MEKKLVAETDIKIMLFLANITLRLHLLISAAPAERPCR
jgi:hypothetical protein